MIVSKFMFLSCVHSTAVCNFDANLSRMEKIDPEGHPSEHTTSCITSSLLEEDVVGKALALDLGLGLADMAKDKKLSKGKASLSEEEEEEVEVEEIEARFWKGKEGHDMAKDKKLPKGKASLSEEEEEEEEVEVEEIEARFWKGKEGHSTSMEPMEIDVPGSSVERMITALDQPRRQEGLGLAETAEDKQWDAMEIYWTDNKLSELPENPKCRALKILWLDNNPDLMEIPQLFFEDMSCLKMLDLSHTSIKCLPPSISRLVSLEKFYLRGCELLNDLPPLIGALGNLEDFDLEGTEIMHLPKEIGELISLRCFKFSFCGHANHDGETMQIGATIPKEVLSTFSRLEELRIVVNPDGEWRDADVKAILDALSSSKKLRVLELYLPSVDLLQHLRWNSGNLMYPDLSRFRFTVGHHQQRIIYRLPHEVEKQFETWVEKSKNCLKYINGEGMPIEITEALKHTSVFFLDRHWTVKLLSEFGHENLVDLEYCLLVECNELQTIIDGDYEFPLGIEKMPALKKLRYLSIHYMKSLQSICRGPIAEDCLEYLTSLALHTCPNLTTVFTPDMLCNMRSLEVLTVEDCFKIKSLVTQESSTLKTTHFLPCLRKISLLDLPELVTISASLCIGSQITSLIIYNCPKLETLHNMEMSPKYCKIKGEKEWWDSLKWQHPEWSTMTQPAYEELRTDDEDFMDQLAKDVYSTKNDQIEMTRLTLNLMPF